MRERSPWLDPWTFQGAVTVTISFFFFFFFVDGSKVFMTHGSGKVVQKYRYRSFMVDNPFKKGDLYVRTDSNNEILIPSSRKLWKTIKVGDYIRKEKRSWKYVINTQSYNALFPFIFQLFIWSIVVFFMILILGSFMKKREYSKKA